VNHPNPLYDFPIQSDMIVSVTLLLPNCIKCSLWGRTKFRQQWAHFTSSNAH